MKLQIVSIGLVFSGVAMADCSVKNDTKYNFTVEMGNVSNHSFPSNNIDNFKGNFSGKSKEGKSFSGTCKASESLVVEEKNGTISVKKR